MQASIGRVGRCLCICIFAEAVRIRKPWPAKMLLLFIMRTLFIQFKRIFNFVWNVILTFIHFYNIRSLYLYISILSQFQMINDHNLKSTHDDSIHTSK